MIRETYSYSVTNNPLFLKMPVPVRVMFFCVALPMMPNYPCKRAFALMLEQEWLYIATCLSAYVMGPCYVVLMFAFPNAASI